MRRAMWTCFVAGLTIAVTTALLLGTAGCGGGEPQSTETSGGPTSGEPSEVATPQTVPTTEVPATEAAPPEPVGTSEPETPDEPVMTSTETEPAGAESPTTLLTWERQGGANSHCDRMTIYVDGRVVANRCVNGVDLETMEAALSEEQGTQLNAWADRFASFSRRESDVIGSAMRTVMTGRGDVVPTTDEKTAVAKFAKQLFLALTTPPA
jgi:hypothetical protein